MYWEIPTRIACNLDICLQVIHRYSVFLFFNIIINKWRCIFHFSDYYLFACTYNPIIFIGIRKLPTKEKQRKVVAPTGLNSILQLESPESCPFSHMILGKKNLNLNRVFIFTIFQKFCPLNSVQKYKIRMRHTLMLV